MVTFLGPDRPANRAQRGVQIGVAGCTVAVGRRGLVRSHVGIVDGGLDVRLAQLAVERCALLEEALDLGHRETARALKRAGVDARDTVLLLRG